MEEITKDSRFSHILKDAKFRRLPKGKVKVKVDKRFQSMFHDKKFQLKYNVDKRGRSVRIGNTDNLERYYDVSESDSNEEDENGDVEDPLNVIESEDYANGVLKPSKKEKNKLTPAVRKKLKDMSIDYARGEGAIFSDSSSEEESSEAEEDPLEFDHGWGELDKDAETTDKATKRLAVCNLDWDRIEATDLMVLFNSFLPSGGIIHSVTIYPSDFGIQRMKEEDEKGPIELVENTVENEEEEQPQIQMERLRKYQLHRLKYYYAVVVCNTPEAAEAIYNECDGLDYECSSSRLDLRFIPDDTTFEQEPKQSCNSMPDLAQYKPRYFVTSALTKAKVDLTWDETDVNRQEIVKSLHSGNIDDTSIRKYLVCSSSEDEVEDEARNSDGKDGSNEKLGYIEKYKALLQDVESNKNKKNEVNMEVTWNLELENKANKVVQDAAKEKEVKTPFEKYLEKKKEKRIKKKQEKVEQSLKEDKHESGDAFSDDDIPSDIDLNDPYFKEELDAFKTKKSHRKKKEIEKDEEENAETKQKKAELELLMLDNEPENKHFSLKKIEEGEKKTSKKLKKAKKRKAKTDDFEDNFKMDVNDERFSALYTSHHFNIDPADPRFKATKGVQQLIEEKLKRRKTEEGNSEAPKRKAQAPLGEGKIYSQNSELLNLIKNIKKNTAEVRKKT